MLRLINCQHATLLIEQRQDPAMPQRERASLWLHLHLCPYCKRYSRQSILIAEWARASAAGRAQAGPGLSAAAKERMREQLVAAG
ncbi:hypothetical protein ACFP2F_05780 [Hymenobacter artigasi]|uniref:Zf-HC2 domain-containing protein n=1 Tax=Hymenobacter artigasi TaxID=2719616 RepID=A0ABX1HDT5_9BACT|nr:hypothetical protein [Hymenobacter artigasi]NKI88370.1 hypothetical protein [Hymenobacter artigasi]